MRLMESMLIGAIPVLLDDWTTPFGNALDGFAVRWSLLYGKYSAPLTGSFRQVNTFT